MNGIAKIDKVVEEGHFKAILSMSQQVFYNLCLYRFIEEEDDRIRSYIKSARPNPVKAALGIYQPVGKSPFLNVCGSCFHHNNVPVIPILHVKNYPIKERIRAYIKPMERAAFEIRKALV